MSLEDIEKELYGQGTRKNSEHTQNSTEKSPHSSVSNPRESAFPKNPWRNEEQRLLDSEPVQKAEKVGSRVFIGLTVALVALLALAGYFLYQYFTTKDARFALQAPEEVRVGEPFILQATFENVSKKTLFAPSVSIQLPQNVILVQDANRRVIRESLSDAQPGESVRREYQVMITGTSYQTYQFDGEASFQYGESTLSSKFQKEASVSVIARNPVVSVDISLPESVMSGQDFELEAKYKNETDAELKDVILKFDIPDSFSLNNSDPKLDAQRQIKLEKLGAHEEGSVIISGFLAERAHTFVPFGVHAQVVISSSAHEVSAKTNSISIATSPLAVSLSSDAANDTVYPGDRLKFSFRITNNASVPLRDVVASVQFSGEYFDLSTLQGEGTLRDANKTYVWTSGRNEALRELGTGASAQLQFIVSLKKNYVPAGDASRAHLQIIASAESETVPPGLTAQKTIGMESYALKIGGDLDVQQAVFYAEPGTEFKNSGPIPPQVGSQTTFSFHWTVSVQGNNMQDVRVRALLGQGMRWTGKVSVSHAAHAPQYNEASGEIVWNAGDVQAGEPAPEAVFQLAFTPASNQAGQMYVFLENIEFEGKDMSTGKGVSRMSDDLDSRDFADAGALPMGYDKIRE